MQCVIGIVLCSTIVVFTVVGDLIDAITLLAISLDRFVSKVLVFLRRVFFLF